MDQILTCNAGSNSLKCAIYRHDDLSLQAHFSVDRIHDKALFSVEDGEGKALIEEESIDPGYEAALTRILNWHGEAGGGTITAAGHRIVHGGRYVDQPVIITDEVKDTLHQLVPLAPLHQPHNLALIDLVEEHLPDIPQIACVDTAFHRSQPDVAQQFALPQALTEEEGILRYGFHGLSYEYIAAALPEHMAYSDEKRIVIAHLGGGASMCALKDGKSVATTMGFTALDGLMMATRCGDLDPGVVLYLQKEKGLGVEEIEELLYKRSGLLGVSGISGDMRDLDMRDNANAKKAVELFCHTAARQLGGLITVMGGFDGLVFTGAMGYGDLLVRAMICDYLGWLGVDLDEIANANDETRISSEASTVDVLRLPTNEEYMIARHTSHLIVKESHDG